MNNIFHILLVFFLSFFLTSCHISKSIGTERNIEPNNHIGELIRKERISKGLTQEELARAINISQNSLSLIEDGLATPIHYKIKEIEYLLDISLNIKH